MSPRTPFRLLLAATALSAAACVAQTVPAPCPANQPASAPCPANQPASAPCAPAAAPQTSSPAQQFPFPGEASKPADNAPNAPKPAADAAHPFPTESPDMPGEAPSSSNSSSSSSSSGSGDTPDTSATPDTPTPTPTRHRLPKVKNLQTPDERVDEDINVAKFYYNRGNFNAAYLRSKDAVKTEPDYAETHFSLAQAAAKMNKTDEARAEYNAYLKLSPGGDNAKAARKALEELH